MRPILLEVEKVQIVNNDNWEGERFENLANTRTQEESGWG